MLLKDRLNCCPPLCFTRSGATSDYRVASVGSPEVVFSIMFLQALRQHQTTELLLCGRPNDSVHAFYCVLHALGQYQTNEVRLWDRPDLCLLNVLSGHQGNTDRWLGGLGVNVYIVFFRSGFRGW